MPEYLKLKEFIRFLETKIASGGKEAEKQKLKSAVSELSELAKDLDLSESEKNFVSILVNTYNPSMELQARKNETTIETKPKLLIFDGFKCEENVLDPYEIKGVKFYVSEHFLKRLNERIAPKVFYERSFIKKILVRVVENSWVVDERLARSKNAQEKHKSPGFYLVSKNTVFSFVVSNGEAYLNTAYHQESCRWVKEWKVSVERAYRDRWETCKALKLALIQKSKKERQVS